MILDIKQFYQSRISYNFDIRPLGEFFCVRCTTNIVFVSFLRFVPASLHLQPLACGNCPHRFVPRTPSLPFQRTTASLLLVKPHEQPTLDINYISAQQLTNAWKTSIGKSGIPLYPSTCTLQVITSAIQPDRARESVSTCSCFPSTTSRYLLKLMQTHCQAGQCLTIG